jgi:molybdopterin-guanine dinucleotide biosynthesis protein A
MTDQPTILILAGKRDGKLDPLAERAGVSHKCRVPINGKPLLEWVVEAVGPAFPDAKVFISIHDPAVVADLPAVEALAKSGRLGAVRGAGGHRRKRRARNRIGWRGRRLSSADHHR